MDVKKLYPSVPYADGIEACRVALNGRADTTIPTESVIEMIETVLHNNNFNLTPDRQFLQTDGTAKFFLETGEKLRLHLHGTMGEASAGQCPLETYGVLTLYRRYFRDMAAWAG